MINRFRKDLSLPSILIFCEGETEVAYFQNVKREYKDKAFITVIKPKDTGSFMHIAEAMKHYLKRNDESFSKIYCIFDSNNLSYEDYQKGVKQMRENGIELIFSRQSFEVRFLMHFSKFAKPVMNQDEYEKLIQQYFPSLSSFKKPYPDMFELLETKREQAIENAKFMAKKLLKENNGEKFKCEPYTDVWKVFENLN